MSQRMPGYGGPTLTHITTPYYEAAAEGRFIIQQCDDCGFHRHLPIDVCYHCHSWNWHWDETLPGTGSVFTWTWVDRPMSEALAEAGTYNISVVELDGIVGGPIRLLTNVFGVTKETLTPGLKVKVAFDPVEGQDRVISNYGPNNSEGAVHNVALVVFEPIEGAAA